MEPKRKDDLQNLNLRNQFRFLVFLYWLRLSEQFKPRSRRAHWLGSKRYRRPERVFILLTFLEAAFILEPFEFALWSMICGSIVAILVFIKSLSMVFSK